MNKHSDLEVWQESVELVKLVYALSASFPDDERYGLTSQIRRSAVSIPSNIAEGHARNSDKDFVRFLRIAYGSSAELETQLFIAHELELVSGNDFATVNTQLTSVMKMLNKFMGSIAKS